MTVIRYRNRRVVRAIVITVAAALLIGVRVGAGRAQPVSDPGQMFSPYVDHQGTIRLPENDQIDCIGCHAPARDSDWVFTGGYPTLGKK